MTIFTVHSASGRRFSAFLPLVLLPFLLSVAAQAGELEKDEKTAVLESIDALVRNHEGRPAGVPSSYDWYARPVIKLGNHPGVNKALTGWGHAFWAQYTGFVAPELQLRDLRVYLCSGEPSRWHLVQNGPIDGREFDADFRENLSRDAAKFQESRDTLTVIFNNLKSFHFWPRNGRYALPHEKLCGVVVTVYARQLASTDNAKSARLLLGLGADYWRDIDNEWNGKDSNPGVAVGQLKYVSTQWHWHALNTSSREDTIRLIMDGYATVP
ncbi:MAG TPA: hypothetical protein PKD55_16475 [Bellilinea sp.]|nr:hypothetical protein [Bellilinea sp.]